MTAASAGTRRRGRRAVIGTVMALLAVPPALTVIEAARFHVRNRSNGSIVSSGQEREYLVYVPPSYDGATPTPLVVSLHGGASWPAAQRDLSRWNRLADEHGFIVVYPAGLGEPRRWETFDAGAGLERDVRFIAELIDTLQSAYAIDPARIYADGLSNGGGMALVLSCTLADRIAAVGMVAPAQTLSPGWCPDARPMPMMAFHGDADRFVPYGGGPMGDPISPVRPVFPAVRDWMAAWVERNRCAAAPVESAVARDVVRVAYRECADGAEVVLHTILGGGHTWPGGTTLPKWFVGATSTSIDATRAFWEFFREHPLRGGGIGR